MHIQADLIPNWYNIIEQELDSVLAIDTVKCYKLKKITSFIWDDYHNVFKLELIDICKNKHIIYFDKKGKFKGRGILFR